MDTKTKLKNDIMLAMENHISSTDLAILGTVLVKALAGVEVVRIETLPATVDDTNAYIWEMFVQTKGKKLSAGTVDYYKLSIGRLVAAVGKTLLEVNSIDIEYFLDTLKADNGPVSLNNHRRNVSAFFTWMRKAHLILENPCDPIDPYREVRKPIDHLEPEEFEQLKSGCRHPRDRAIIEVLRSTAARVGELEGIRVSDVDWRTGQVDIYGEKGRAVRPVCLDSVAMKYVSDYVLGRGSMLRSDEPLFTHIKGDHTKGIKRAAIREALDGIRKRAEMQRRVYPHLFRKTTATNIVRRGGSTYDAGEYLGHKDRTTAGQHYVYKGADHTMDIFNRYVKAV